MVKSQPILRYILRGIPAIAVAVLLSACSANNTAKNMHPEKLAVMMFHYPLHVSQDAYS
ncbi:bifunctional murein DD-endopeptidase/murein LD-carboxypeptidase, partial [Escherichia coli]|nr:bifunctional murein DD-endopeptidase/murein LD-carboxypeptidase [Escherichia coli]